MQDKKGDRSAPPIILFNSLLLPPSQTFVCSLGESLQNFTPYYVGSRRVPGLDLPSERTLVVNRGNLLGSFEEGNFKLLGFSPRLYQQIQKINPVLINAQFGLSGVLALPLARTLQIPLLVHFRGADATVKEEYARYSSFNHWIYYRRRETLKRETRLFIAVSNFIKTKLLEQGFPSEKIIVHYDGIDTAEFKPNPAIQREPIVLFVGRLTEKKGCEYLIRAMAIIQSVLPEVELIIIGDGSLRSDLEALAAKLLKRYQFLGFQPLDAVKNWLNRARLLAVPSVTSKQGDAEGLPTVVVEAQAMELPIIGTLHAGIPEAVMDGQTGFLVPERDYEGLAEFGLQLLQNIQLWQHCSKQARKHMEKNFNRSKQTQILESMYESVRRG
jgi:colanic acid/amylovoran biosynthesis glycosyltransferase